MIGSITFRKVARAKASDGPNAERHAAWALDLPEIAARGGRIDFKPGLNVLFGPNGCGKSTIAHTLALHLMAHKNGSSCVTLDSINEMMGRESFRSIKTKSTPDPIAADVEHDGQPLVYGSAGKLLIGPDRSFDTSFLDGYGTLDGLAKDAKRTHGSRNLAVNQGPLRILLGQSEFPSSVARARDARPEAVNDVWKRMIGVADRLLEARLPKGQGTVVLDEPDAHLSLLMQARIWRDVLGNPEVANRLQVIVATHSPFALAVPHAHVIGLPDAYVEACRKELGGLAESLSRR